MFPETCFHKCLPGGKAGREHENTCRSPNWLNEETCFWKHRGCMRSFKLAPTSESGDGTGNILLGHLTTATWLMLRSMLFRLLIKTVVSQRLLVSVAVFLAGEVP